MFNASTDLLESLLNKGYTAQGGSEPVDFAEIVKQLGLEQPFPGYWEGWDHQLVGRHKAIKNRRLILGMDKGVGKTSTILSIFEDKRVHRDVRGFTVLGFTSQKGMAVYERDIKLFPNWQDKIVLVHGDRGDRERAWKTKGHRYFITTYQSFLSDVGARVVSKDSGKKSAAIVPGWVTDLHSIDGVFADEFHRVLRSRKSTTFDIFGKLFKKSPYFFPMSGSAVSKGPQDIWSVLHLCDPKLWSSYWNYVSAYCEVDETGFGKSITGPKVENLKYWRQMVSPYLFYCKAEWVKDMPPIMRSTLDVEMNPEQRKLHDELLKQMYSETPDGEFLFASNAMVRTHKVRLALICPKALNTSYGYGQGIVDIVDDAQESELTRYVIATPVREPIPYLKEYLESRGAKVWILWGGIGLKEQEARLQQWRDSLKWATAENPSVLIYTVKYGESWEAPEARYGYMLDYEWDGEENKQAESRLARLTSIGTTFWQYVKYKDSYNEKHLQRLVDQGMDVRLMFKSWDEFRKDPW